MTADELAGLRKTELLAIARERGIRGRSTMSKAELVAALAAAPSAAKRAQPGDDEVAIRTVETHGGLTRDSATGGRAALADRLAAAVDGDGRCTWISHEGDACGLPRIAGEPRCALHGGIDIYDRAVAVTGRLGFDTWPTLLRHLRMATYDTDTVGLDPVVAEMVWHVVNLLYFDYFRVTVEGAEHLPPDGPVVVAANHGGAALPYDAFMLTAAVANESAVPRRLRVIGTEIFNMLPVISHLYRKAGGAYASREDADHLLRHGRMVGVFPEGERGFMKPVWDAYQLQRFGRGGFLALAERHSAPVVPTAIVGSEEVHPAVGVSETLARLVRLVFPSQRVDQVAVVLNPVPLPVRWRIRFLPPVAPEGESAARDPLRMLERTEEIRGSIQAALDELVADRGSKYR
jgi:1-acyl-sn-glycerol-3-phosphate acyltransferase